VSRTTILFFFALLLACFWPAPRALAQTEPATGQTSTTATNPAQQRSASATPSKPNDIEITANVTARELRFEVVPNPTVEFPGSPERETAWEAERQNLPRPVQPGVTYRNIGVQLKITSVFADIDRIVAEALGEVPVTDDRPQQEATPQATPAPQTDALPPATTSPSTTREGKP
jgi:hypothetical protein